MHTLSRWRVARDCIIRALPNRETQYYNPRSVYPRRYRESRSSTKKTARNTRASSFAVTSNRVQALRHTDVTLLFSHTGMPRHGEGSRNGRKVERCPGPGLLDIQQTFRITCCRSPVAGHRPMTGRILICRTRKFVGSAAGLRKHEQASRGDAVPRSGHRAPSRRIVNSRL